MECVLFQPIGNQQMTYSEPGPTVSGKNNSVTSNFVLGTDDRIEYAELDHRHSHAPASADTAKTTSLAISDNGAGIFGKLLQYHLYLWPLDVLIMDDCSNISQITDVREDSPSPPPLPPKYTMI